jgi:hypothetical protein
MAVGMAALARVIHQAVAIAEVNFPDDFEHGDMVKYAFRSVNKSI